MIRTVTNKLNRFQRAPVHPHRVAVTLPAETRVVLHDGPGSPRLIEVQLLAAAAAAAEFLFPGKGDVGEYTPVSVRVLRVGTAVVNHHVSHGLYAGGGELPAQVTKLLFAAVLGV